MILGHRREAGTCYCRDCGVDSPLAGTFRYVQQDAAARQIEVSRSLAETEDGVRAESRQRSIREGKLGARIAAGSHGCAWADVVVH